MVFERTVANSGVTPQSSLHLNTNASIITLGTETIHAPIPKPPWISPFNTVHIHDANKLRHTKSTSIQNMALRLGPSMMWIPHPIGNGSQLSWMLSCNFFGRRSIHTLRGWLADELK